MSRSSGERPFRVGDRAAVEPIAALVAVAVVGAALGLYVVALDDASTDQNSPAAAATLDRIEPVVTVGGVVEPDRLNGLGEFRFAALVELEADGETWRVRSGVDAPEPDDVKRDRTAADASDRDARSESTSVAERSVTVRVGPGRNVRGTLRTVVRR